jgi:hypothetical protein
MVFSQSLTLEDIVRQYDEYIKTISVVSYEFSDSVEGGLSGKIKYDGKNQQFWNYINVSKDDVTETRVHQDIVLQVFYDSNEYKINSSLKPMATNVAVTVNLQFAKTYSKFSL